MSPPASPRRARIARPQIETPASVDPESLVLVGVVQGAFGVRGEVRVRPFTQTPEGVVAYGPLFREDGRPALTPVRWRAVKDGLALFCREVKDREAAEALRNLRLFVPRAALPTAGEDEFYHVDLIGLKAESLDGAPLGEVIAVHDFGAGDLLELRGLDGKTWFCPFTKAAAPLVDIAKRRVVLDPPPEAG